MPLNLKAFYTAASRINPERNVALIFNGVAFDTSILKKSDLVFVYASRFKRDPSWDFQQAQREGDRYAQDHFDYVMKNVRPLIPEKTAPVNQGAPVMAHVMLHPDCPHISRGLWQAAANEFVIMNVRRTKDCIIRGDTDLALKKGDFQEFVDLWRSNLDDGIEHLQNFISQKPQP